MKRTLLLLTIFAYTAFIDAAIFTVTTVADSGPGSLRQAILDANSAGSPSTISFSAAGTIVLAAALPTITADTSIVGPGTNLLTISGNNSVRLLSVAPGAAAVTISSLTFANALASGHANGAAISNAGVLSVSGCVFLDNTNLGGWGGAIFNSGGRLSLTGCFFAGNAVIGEDGAGGEPYNLYGNNGAGGGGAGLGGGIFCHSGETTISGCEFTTNSAVGGKGGSNLGNGRGGGAYGGDGGAYGDIASPGGFGGGGGGSGNGGSGNGYGAAGGFGGGGGGGAGPAGFGGGNGAPYRPNRFAEGGGGGGGAGIGGAIFVYEGTTTVVDSLFAGNRATGGIGGTSAGATGLDGSGIAPDFYSYAGTILPILTAHTDGGGTVSISPTAPPYLDNSLATVTANPAPGWTFAQWLGDASETNPVATLHMTRNKTVKAVFATPLTASSSVIVSPATTLYPYGTVVKLTPVLSAGSCFVAWSGDASGTNSPADFMVTNANPSVSCQFSDLGIGETSLTVIETGKGRVVVVPSKQRFFISDTIGLIPTPEPGQEFIGWSGDVSGTQNPLLVSMVQSKVIAAHFTKRPTMRVNTPLEGLVEDGFRMTLLGDFGSVYQLFSSTNLSDWLPVGWVTNIWGTVQFTDPQATNKAQLFYKAVSSE